MEELAVIRDFAIAVATLIYGFQIWGLKNRVTRLEEENKRIQERKQK